MHDADIGRFAVDIPRPGQSAQSELPSKSPPTGHRCYLPNSDGIGAIVRLSLQASVHRDREKRVTEEPANAVNGEQGAKHKQKADNDALAPSVEETPDALNERPTALAEHHLR